MKFTGERYIPTEGGDIRHEHLHRYAWCMSLVEGKDVLDIACGEGYGSAMLVKQARSVVGVDIADETIRHAQDTYAGLKRLQFKQGDAAQIPLEDGSVDVVVSFETIEHHDRHQEMIDEIHRVLRPDGLLVMSSPNRVVYSEQAGYHNEFHVKELDFDEFDALLKSQFDQVCYFGQRLAVGSFIFTLDRRSSGKTVVPFTDTGSNVVKRAASLADPIYYIAVAGAVDRHIQRKLHPSVFFSEAEDLYTHHRKVAAWAKSLDGELTDLREQYAKSVADGNRVSDWGKSLSEEKLAQGHALAAASKQLADKTQQQQEISKAGAENRQIADAAVRGQTQALQLLREAEQRAEVARRERDNALAAWQTEKEIRVAAEQQVQTQTKAASEAYAAWQSEKEVRLATEQHLQAQAEETRKAQGAWQTEKEIRVAAEQQVQTQTKTASEARAAWQSEKEARLAAEQRSRAQTEEARKAQAAWQSEREASVAAVTARDAALVAATELQEKMQVEHRTSMHGLKSAVEANEKALIESRGELVKREARIVMLEHVHAELSLIQSSRSWRWTRPMRSATSIARRALHAGGAARAAAASTDHRISVITPTADVAQINLHAAARDRRDYFVWAVIDWHFRIQRPQHLARELAADGNRVFYISNNFIDDPTPGFRVEPLDSDGRLFQINLHVRGKPAIYHAAPDAPTAEQLRASMRELLAWTHSTRCVSLVQHPFWIEATSVLPNHRLAYDCMDHHGGFSDNTQDVLEREYELMNSADLLIVTSDWLQAEAGEHNPNCLMVRNACQYEHFSRCPSQVFKDPQGRKIIGYYGAIAEWFDLDLVEAVARRFSKHLVLLVGDDTAGARSKLQHLNNVQFAGEVAYATLPYYLYAFDVCLLPFKVIPLTLATNPVKVYEYLSAGRSVVSVDLPEMRQFGDLIRTANNTDSFIDAVATVLTAKPDLQMYAQRQAFAAAQTWSHRVTKLIAGVDALEAPRASVIVVTYNNLEYTQACLSSLELYSDYTNMEVIVVDNASSDGSPSYLKEWQAAGPDRQLILNNDNRGFAAANNQGLKAATGEYLVMLNNDTYVTPGWVGTLVNHMRRTPVLGMLGPVTNNIGNEARIEIEYPDMAEMLRVAGDYTRRHAGQLTPLHTAAFFCVMLRRSLFEQVGPLDEAFGIGFFEDDDYCRRVEQAGYTVACADDVFVHHNLSASFNKLKQETRQALFERNKTVYEAKWGEWVPHRYRDSQ